MSKKNGVRQSRASTWFKFHSENHLWGSTRSELNPDERAVWVDFLCLGTMNFGEIEVFSRDQLAQQLLIDRKLLDRSIDKFIKYGKIEGIYIEEENIEIFSIRNWDKYQADYLKKRQGRLNADEEKERIKNSEKSDAEIKPILEERREDKTILKEITSEEINQAASKDATSLSTNVSVSSLSRYSRTNGISEEEKSIKKSFLLKLKRIPDYPFDESLDSTLFDDIRKECPGIDILKELDKKVVWFKKHPDALKFSGNNRRLFKNWFKGEYKIEK